VQSAAKVSYNTVFREKERRCSPIFLLISVSSNVAVISENCLS
jgi:hypothetical protein